MSAVESVTPYEDPIRDAFEKIMAGYVRARSSESFGKEHPLWTTFVSLKGAFDQSEPIQDRNEAVSVQWSVGQGNWARIPWLGVRDKRSGLSSKQGIGIGYLFREDMTGVYLVVGYGTEDLIKTHGRNSAREMLKTRVADDRRTHRDIMEIAAHFDISMDLHSDYASAGDYEAGCVLCKCYERGQVPEDHDLLQDLETALTVNEALVEAGQPSWGLSDRFQMLLAHDRPTEESYAPPNSDRHMNLTDALTDLVQAFTATTPVRSRPYLHVGKLYASDGMRHPWIMFSDRRITTTFRSEGVFVLLLARGDNTGFYLMLTQGIPEHQPSATHEQRLATIATLRPRIAFVDAAGFRRDNDIDPRPIDPDTRQRFVTPTIAWKFYSRDDMPKDDVLLQDLEAILQAYDLHLTNIGLGSRNGVKVADMRDALARALESQGLSYSDWQIATFCTALQTKGFVILSGISGTGKTKLVQQFAELLLMPEYSNTVSELATAEDAAGDDEFEVDDQSSDRGVVLTARPSLLDHRRFTIPKWSLSALGLPVQGDVTHIDVVFESSRANCRLDQRHGPQNDSTILVLQGDVARAVVGRMSVGDQFRLVPALNESGKLLQLAIEPLGAPKVRNVTRIPQTSATQQSSNLLFLPVRPDWRDSKSLLGYYNPLTETYEWTPFLRLLLDASRSYRDGDGLAWFVVLDEMNLAHVEYYFADLLSVLESGRDADGWTRESLRLQYPDSATDVPPRELRLPPNLYVVGTVNIDETTHAFSPKVLDRAFSIELVEVDFSGYPPSAASTGTTMSDDDRRALLTSFTRNARFPRVDKREIAGYVERHPEVRDHLQTLNTLLRPYSMHFGYRVFDEIVAFLAIAEENRMFDALAGAGQFPAFDAAVLMKVLPKFHGSRSKLEEPLTSILAWCLSPASPNLMAVQSLGITPSQGLSYTLPRTAERVTRMLRELQIEGFTAFG